jgi:predicted Fe-Mo cluster-binding NifX family protein
LGIRVYAGAPRKTPQDLVLDFLNGKLTLSDARCHH